MIERPHSVFATHPTRGTWRVYDRYSHARRGLHTQNSGHPHPPPQSCQPVPYVAGMGGPQDARKEIAMSDEKTERPVRNGCKRVPVTIMIHTYEDVPEDWDEDATRFWIEENHCLGNYLKQIQEDEQRAADEMGVKEPAGICQLCAVAEAYVGHRPFLKRE